MKTVYNSEHKRKERVYLSTQSLNILYANEKIKVGEKELKDCIEDIVQTKSVAWINNPARLTYRDGTVFKPSRYVKGVEIKEKVDEEVFNLWDGYSVAAIKNITLLAAVLYHIEHIICSGNKECFEYLMNWIAYGLQNPHKNGQVAVACKGEKGSGKGLLGNFIKRLYGQHGLQVTNPKHLTGSFNAHMADCCFLFADEVIFAGDKVVENIMKGLITEDTLMIERKGIDAECMTNRLKIFMASNNDWIAPASKDERRYFVLNVSSEQIGNEEYFKELSAAMQNTYVQSAFLYEMLHRDISGFTVGKVPDTKALQHQRLQSLDSFGHYWCEVLQRGFVYETQHGHKELRDWHYEVANELIMRGYTQWFNRNKIGQYGIVARPQVNKHLTSWYGEKKRKINTLGFFIGETLKGEIDASMKQTYVYTVGTQDAAINSFCSFEKLDVTDLSI
jgi:hypothetical protein